MAGIVSLAAASPSATKQRIAVVVHGTVDTGGDFELTPLKAGSLQPDKGGVTFTGALIKRGIIRNGQLVPAVVTENMSSKNGTFKLLLKIQSIDLADGYSSDSGTWSFKAGTGVYAGFKGTGRLAGVGLPTAPGAIINKAEGFVTRG